MGHIFNYVPLYLYIPLYIFTYKPINLYTYNHIHKALQHNIKLLWCCLCGTISALYNIIVIYYCNIKGYLIIVTNIKLWKCWNYYKYILNGCCYGAAVICNIKELFLFTLSLIMKVLKYQ